MPLWLLRLLWFVRGKRFVRLHLSEGPSVQGVLAGRVGGHYVLLTPSVLEATDRTVRLDGHLEVPRERVLFVQVLDKAVP